MPDVKRAASIEEQDLRMRQLAGGIAAARQVSFDGSVVTFDNTETSIEPTPIGVASQLLQSALVITVIRGLRGRQAVISAVRISM